MSTTREPERRCTGCGLGCRVGGVERGSGTAADEFEVQSAGLVARCGRSIAPAR
ncbi:hypothetical protein M2260_000443 [Rhodococcus erythropolis]|uniref:hypothetical protein n=1 Tax=Rhodococcus erythropolis TaxID=1833 RepID=UPI002224680B|nr:hypothetical protein [Rhodococcus erythropolis]MCW2425535.1 hypothetical protein [Rhodococcus erythropolis]